MEKIQVVLASPSDLIEERQMIQDLVNNLNPQFMKHDICIDLRMWENAIPGMSADGPQGVIDIDLEIPKADIFLCLYWQKIGTLIEGENIAGTEHELNLALESYHKKRKPDIKAFFKDIEYGNEINDDVLKIKEIIKKLQPKGLYFPFKNSSELKDKIYHILQNEVMCCLKEQSAITPEIHKYIEVSSSVDLIKNFSSNNKLVLNKGFYDILDFTDETEFANKEEVFDGMELVIHDLSNVTVVGDNSTLLVSPRYANVINFKNCSNIKLIGLTLGHTPHKGSCLGSVLRFENCSNIQIESLNLFGCGTYGVDLQNCNNIKVNGTRIFECSYGALNIIDSNIDFENSMIYDCNKIAGCLIEASNSHLNFDNISIFNNYIDNYLISLHDSSLFCNNVCICSNSFAALCNQDIPFGIFTENNVLSSSNVYNLVISSLNKISLDLYHQIKESALKYGEINESIFDDGQIYINVIFCEYKKAEELENALSIFSDLEFSVG